MKLMVGMRNPEGNSSLPSQSLTQTEIEGKGGRRQEIIRPSKEARMKEGEYPARERGFPSLAGHALGILYLKEVKGHQGGHLLIQSDQIRRSYEFERESSKIALGAGTGGLGKSQA